MVEAVCCNQSCYILWSIHSLITFMSINYTSNFSLYGDFHNPLCHTNILNTVHIVLHAREADVQGKSIH